MMADTKEVTEQTQEYFLEVKLEDGEALRAALGSDLEAARAQLASVYTDFGGDGFVLLGEDTVVRSRDIRYVQLRRDEGNGHGLLDALKSRVGGGGPKMSTYGTENEYETQQMHARQAHGVRAGRADDERGFGEPWLEYRRRSWETKPFFLTSEFLTLIGAIAAVAIAMAVSDVLDATRGWTLVTVLAAAYMLSRGIAKAGSREPAPHERR
jgi:hypothetical protein